ncbi:MAG: DUF1707 domain-containing protein [Actinomycetes bacterium]
MSQHLPERAGDVWSRFTADPRRQPSLRASDADRDVAADALNAAFGDGRLDPLEHSDRLERALAARQLGQLVPLLIDITASGRRKAVASSPRRVRSVAVRVWLGLAVLFNVIWVATWLFALQAPYYYWPIWPMIGTAIPLVIIGLTSGGGNRPHEPGRRAIGR